MKQRFGNYVGKLHVGDGFGELAIISEKDKRTASIVADEELHLLTVDKTNYLRVLKAHREKEMRGVVAFLKTVPIMAMMGADDIYHLAEVMVSRRYLSDEVVLAQGEAPEGLFFIRSGKCKVVKDLPMVSEKARLLRTMPQSAPLLRPDLLHVSHLPGPPGRCRPSARPAPVRGGTVTVHQGQPVRPAGCRHRRRQAGRCRRRQRHLAVPQHAVAQSVGRLLRAGGAALTQTP